MSGGRSDASTSTDDVKGRPLCLFYFTHPFGVLSPEPPTLAAAPPHIAQAFLNMQPVSPFFWSSAATASATATSTAASDDLYQSSSDSTTLNYDIGNTTVHRDPVSVVSVTRTRTRKCTVDFPSRRDSLSSSLFSSDIWFNSTCSSKSNEYPRRVVPYNRILPPLRLPSPRDLLEYSSDDVWPRKCLNPEKFSLPPIELPVGMAEVTDAGAGAGAVHVRLALEELSSSVESVSVRSVRRAGGRGRGRLRLGVDKQRRQRGVDVRRMITCLMRRAIRGGTECSGSPALQRVLHTIRDAWAEPSTLWDRCRTLSRSYAQPFVPRRYATPERDLPARAMPRAPLPDQQTRPDASPGLLRRRYSVPETIMRKYRLAQQRSDSEESGAATHASPASACHSPPREASCSPCDSPHRFIRRDRELMRKSALLRRMWARPCRAPACCCCPDTARETRSLDGSRSELRAPSSSRCPPDRVTAPWTSPKRQRLTAAADLSDSTFQSHRADRNLNYTETPTDVFTDSEASRFGYAVESRNSPPSSERLSEPATAEPESEERSPPDTDPQDAPSFAESDTISASLSTAKETNGSYAPPQGPLSSNGHIEGRVSERSIGVENDDRNLPPYGLPLTIESPAPPYELLEIVVSETLDATISPMPAAKPLGEAVFKNGSALTYFKYGRNLNIDEYVSNILVESLNSLTDQLEFMNASIGGDRKISIVEKEIKVKLQNTGVNTIVHLSPTSNNPIIFGNEELCNEPRRVRDECNNPLSIRDERDHSLESNNNLTSSAGSASRPRSAAAPEPAFEPPLQHDNVNRAVLQQIQKLFRDELRNLDEGEYAADAPPGVSHVEISNVDVYLDNHRAEGAAARGELEIATRADGDLIGGVGTGNYYRDSDEVVTVPRFSAFPHTESMEVNTSSSEDADAAYSDCTSLVDSLDDPNSPRAVLLRRRGDLVRSAVDVLELLPEGARAPTDMRSEAFFIRIEDNERSRHEEGNVKVAEYMPEKIKQKLHRRHRKRELRMECARRSKVKQLKKELEARRHEEMARARREAERECMMIVNALIDDVIAKIAQDELKCMRIKHRNNKMITAKSEENLSKRHRRKDLEAFIDGDDGRSFKNSSTRRSSDKENRKSERHQIRGKLIARPSLASTDRPPRRIYQKSEIHEGEKCIEILEILEYVNGSQSSPETTNSDECHNQNTRCKKSRIPIPVYERIQKTSKSDILQRLTGGDGRHASPPPAGRLLADMLLQALAAEEPQRVLAPAAVPTEPRSRSNSLRFKRVFDIIPEERSSLSFDSSAEDAELARRASAPDVVVPTSIPPPVSAPAADQSPRRGSCTRSAGTSPIADEERTRRLRSQTTMTSPCSKSAATSPLRPPAPAPPHRRPAREGDREKIERAVNPRANISECSRDRTGAGCCGDEESAGSAHAHSRPRRATHPNGVRSKGRVPLPVRTETKACDRRRGSISGEPSRSPDEEDACRKPREERPRGSAGGGGGGSSSDSGDSGGSLLCSLAPRWLSGPARQRRRVRRPAPPAPPAPESPPPLAPPPPLTDREPAGADAGAGAGGWSVTVAGSCRAALPHDVEMRLRFPHDHPPTTPRAAATHLPQALNYQECTCVQCAACAEMRGRAALPPAPPSHHHHDGRLTLTMKKEAQDSSILASKSVRKSSEQLPELETYRASRTKLKSSVKTRRGYSLHCWLPEDEPAPIRGNNGLSVLGCAIIPELKPRVPTMSERDLTRVYTPRHYLRS